MSLAIFKNRCIAAIVLLCGCYANASAADLKEKTATAFDRYVSATEARFNNELKPGGAFLYVDALPQQEMKNSYDRLKQGEILVERLKTQAPGLDGDVPDGMLHHWVGLVFVPGVTLQQTLPVVQDYDHRSDLYRPEVIASKLVSREGDDFKIFLRLYEKKFTTVVFNTNYDVRWGRVAPNANVFQFHQHTHYGSERCVASGWAGVSSRPGQRLPMATQYLLALRGERRRGLHTV